MGKTLSFIFLQSSKGKADGEEVFVCTRFILGRQTSWQSSWLELGIKKKVFLSSSQVPCMPPSKPKVAGRCSLPHAFDVASTSCRGSAPRGRGLADSAHAFSKCNAMYMLYRTKLGSTCQPRANSAEKQFVSCHSTDYT